MTLLRSVRVRATLGALAVVAVVLVAGSVLLVWLVRDSLTSGLETTAEDRAEEIADQLLAEGLPEVPPPSGDDDDDDDDIEPESLVWQVADRSGAVLRTSQPLASVLPRRDEDAHRISGGDDAYLVRVETEGEYVVTVAVSTEDVGESTEALVPLLAVGVPLVLVVVGGVTALVVGRALSPVEAIRREVEAVSAADLHRRVPEPGSRDEIHRLAVTMNGMLGRLESAAESQRRFVSDASHELRSPLASLRQTAEVAALHPEAMSADELTEAVLEETLRMQRLVEQLLALSRADASGTPLETTEVDLDDLVLDHAARLRSDVVEVDTSAVMAVRVRANQVALSQVVRNLLDNAARHARGRVEVSLVEEGGAARLTVSDDGAGVPAGEEERIFERFVRLDEARSRDAGGSGLGLALVRELVRVHGGAVSVDRSTLGGARFHVRLPVRSV